MPLAELIAGLLLLYFGADWLVNHSSILAIRLGIRPFIIALTIIALGTSAPEIVVSMAAALRRSESLAIGNIIGSNIANIGLILGVSALVHPLKVDSRTLRIELPFTFLVGLVFVWFCLDGQLSRVEGIIFVAGLLAFWGFIVLDAIRHPALKEHLGDSVGGGANRRGSIHHLLLLLAGLAFLLLGAQLAVLGAVSIARHWGLSELYIGLTILALGSSLPELSTSVVGALRRQHEIAIANVVGSNILNILFVLGIVCIITPLSVEASLFSFDLPVLLLFTVGLLPLAKSGMRISRFEGAWLLAGYLGYLTWITIRQFKVG